MGLSTIATALQCRRLDNLFAETAFVAAEQAGRRPELHTTGSKDGKDPKSIGMTARRALTRARTFPKRGIERC
jgi:hypothetical protein